MKIDWQNVGRQPLGQRVLIGHLNVSTLLSVCSSTAYLLPEQSSLCTLKICLVSTSHSELVVHTFSWFWWHCWNRLWWFSLLMQYENRIYIFKFNSKNNFLAALFLHSHQALFALNWSSEFWFWACFGDRWKFPSLFDRLSFILLRFVSFS